MGKVKNNVATRGFSGKLGEDIVFRQVDGKTTFAKRTLSNAAPSERQTEVRNRFTEAALMASAQLENPELYTEYKLISKQQGFKTAYMAAVSDILTLPEIGGLFTLAYKGKVGNLITMKSRIPYKIKSIDVRILAADGTLLESGPALAHESKWRYVATVENPQVAGSRLVLVARDRLDKEVTVEVVL
jgi:hypothetical protein